MQLPSLKRVRSIEGKRVLVRVDFNVPMRRKKILDASRLHAAIPTIMWLQERGARIILVSHMGRPEGKKSAAFSLEPVAQELSRLIKKKITFLSDLSSKKIEPAIARMKKGQILLLENIRFLKDEEKKDSPLGEYLASLIDVFVLDGFGVAHRADASVVGIAPFVPSYAGLLLEKEIRGLDTIMEVTHRPAVLVLGGAKAQTKLPVIKNFLNRADTILVGGTLVNTYLKACGYSIGMSQYDRTLLAEAKHLLQKKKVITPADVIVGTADGTSYRHVHIHKQMKRLCLPKEAILDIGPLTIRNYAQIIKKAKTIVWNGAMGYFEQPPYDTGTKAIARLIATRAKGPAYGVVGGGETVQALCMVGMEHQVDLVSTGGGAMLEYLSGQTLPGLEALRA